MLTVWQTDRNTKRSSRKEGHREDRTRRSEKESHDRPRESDRRREREAPEAELRHPLSERVRRFRTFHHYVAHDRVLAW